jgi:hypothetical protein
MRLLLRKRRPVGEKLSLAEGLWLGLQMAAALSVYAAVVFAIVLVAGLLRASGGALHASPGFLLQLLWVVGGYFAAFALGGVLFAALSELRGTILGYALMGAVLGSTIYGVIAAVSELMEPEPPDWRMVGHFTLVMGVLWGLGGTGMGLYRKFGSRHRA